MRPVIVATVALCTLLCGCVADRATVGTDLTAAVGVAAAAEGFYAAQPGADPTKVAEWSRLLVAAQAAVASWQASTTPADEATARAAVAALLAYNSAAPKAQ